MPVHDELGKRMKSYYEEIPKTRLMRRTPVIIRLDGKAFHTFTRGFKRPFDDILIDTMQETMKYLCENIQGCVLGYHQSDEISLLLIDYKRFNSAAWYDYEIQKVVSISASMATMAFNKFFRTRVERYTGFLEDTDIGVISDRKDYIDTLRRAMESGAMFDSRVFNIPKEEVTNYFYWRQLDAARNSVQMVGQAHFSHKQLHKKTCNMIQDMLMLEKNINWNNFPTHQKRGSCAIKEEYFVPGEGNQVNIPEGCTDLDDAEIEYGTWRTRWIVDTEIPLFVNEDREYIEKLLTGEEK